jgi:hypothetical protein
MLSLNRQSGLIKAQIRHFPVLTNRAPLLHVLELNLLTAVFSEFLFPCKIRVYDGWFCNFHLLAIRHYLDRYSLWLGPRTYPPSPISLRSASCSQASMVSVTSP